MGSPADPLLGWVADARRRTLALADALGPGQLLGPTLPIVNPPLWELGHVAWFQERWVIRHAAGLPALFPGGDALYDSAAIPHDARWALPLPPLAATRDRLRAVAAEVARLLPSLDPAARAFVILSVLHEDMHLEAMAFTRQTLGYPPPPVAEGAAGDRASGPEGSGDLPGDAAVPGGTFRVGAPDEAEFAFDNERPAHEVEVAPFAIARAPVTQAAFRAFVDDGGYGQEALWSPEGWRWREAVRAQHPVHWVRQGGEWLRRDFDRLVPLEPDRPVVNVSWFEAEAWCRFAGRRLPTELEWEVAAAGEPGPDGRLAARKRRFPWGDAPPTPERAHLDLRATEPVDVGAFPAGESAFGCRQLVGNVWEWTGSDFLPYPGFSPGPYREYSLPWFGDHRVVRGGSFATTGRLVSTWFRSFYTPDRRDPWIGFRTCPR